MKKVLSLILVTVLLSLCVLPAFARDLTQDGGKEQTVEASVSHVLGKELNKESSSEQITVSSGEVSLNYVVTIPGDIILMEDQAVEKTITATEVVINKNETITVTVTSGNYDEGWKIEDTEKGRTLTYSIKNNEGDVANGGIAVRFTHQGSKTYSGTISFNLEEQATYTGTYTDTLTFTVSVE